MKNLIKNSFYASAGLSLVGLNIANAAINIQGGSVDEGIVWSPASADQVIQWYVASAMGFLYILAVLIGIWGWFNILTAAWDEEKVKKGKTILIQAVIWLLVIFLADSIINWLLNSILTPNQA